MNNDTDIEILEINDDTNIKPVEGVPVYLFVKYDIVCGRMVVKKKTLYDAKEIIEARKSYDGIVSEAATLEIKVEEEKPDGSYDILEDFSRSEDLSSPKHI